MKATIAVMVGLSLLAQACSAGQSTEETNAAMLAEIETLCSEAVTKLSQRDPFSTARQLVEDTNPEFFDVLNDETMSPIFALEGAGAAEAQKEALARAIQDLIGHMDDVRVLFRDGRLGEIPPLLETADAVIEAIDTTATDLGSRACVGASLAGGFYDQAATFVEQELGVTPSTGDFGADAARACAAYIEATSAVPDPLEGADDILLSFEIRQPATTRLAEDLRQAAAPPVEPDADLDAVISQLDAAAELMQTLIDDFPTAIGVAFDADGLVERALDRLEVMGVGCR